MEHRSSQLTILGLLIAVGIALGGYFIGHGLLKARSSDRYVTVKGLSEREAAANLVLWPIVYTVTADDLETLQQRLDDGAAKIQSFLGDRFNADEVSTSAPRVTDRQAQGVTAQQGRLERYVAEATVTVRTRSSPSAETVATRPG